MRYFLFLSLIFFASKAFCADAKVDQKDFTINGRIISDIKLENHDSQNSRQEYDDALLKVRLFVNLNLSHGFSINSQTFLNRFDGESGEARRLNSDDGGGDRFMENMGLGFRELNLSKTGENYTVSAGKFNLNFGEAWIFSNGIWLRDLANQNYRQQEKIGLRGNYEIGDLKKTGRYNFGFTAFTNDTKNLDKALINNRDSSKKSDANPGDTRSLESYLATLKVSFDFAENEKLSYHFGYLNMAVNGKNSSLAPAKIADQKSWVANIDYLFPAGDKFGDLSFRTFAEFAEVKNLDGNSDISEKYLTASVDTIFNKNFSFLSGISQRQNMQIGLAGIDQRVIELSAKYSFLENKIFDLFTIQLGFQDFRTNYKTYEEKRQSLGLLLRYYKNF